MPKLTTAFLAGTLAFAGSPVLAFELPDTGSKNFSASGDTPTYFKNETAPVSARIADTTERDWSAADEAAPARSVAEPGPEAYPDPGHWHGRYASVRRYGKHAASFPSARATAAHFGKASPGRSTRTAPAGSGKTSGARHGKSSARHA